MTTKNKYFHHERQRLFGTHIQNCHPPLTKLEQSNLHKKIKNGDNNAKETVISSCLPLVVNIAQKFRVNNRHIDTEDFIQEGNIALMKAVDNWDINKGSISTVATWYIRNAFIDMINDSKYVIRYPYSLSRRAAEELRKVKSFNSNDVGYISKQTGLSKKRVKKLLHVSPKGSQRVSLHCQDVKRIRQALEYTEETVKKPCIGDLIELINHNLIGDQKTIFCLWAGVNKKKMGPKEIAKSLGKSEQYVYNNIYGAKRILSRIAKKVHIDV